MVDPVAKNCTTLAGSGKAGKQDCSILKEVEFNEPGGLCVTPDGCGLFVADTNNHVIRYIDMKIISVKELRIIQNSSQSCTEQDSSCDGGSKFESILSRTCKAINQLDPVSLSVKSQLTVQLDVRLPKDCKLTEGAPSMWQVYTEDSSGNLVTSIFQKQKTKLGKLQQQPSCAWTVDSFVGFHGVINIEVKVYYCEDSGTCHMQGILFRLPVTINNDEAKTNVNIVLRHDI